MKKGLAALLAVAVLTGCGESDQTAATAKGGVPNPLRIATESAYPPFVSADPTGKLVGFDMDVMDEICRRMAVTCEITPQNWDGIIPGLQAGRYDAIIGGMSITDERRQVIAFTQAYANTPAFLVALKDSPLQQLDVQPDRIGLDAVDAAEQAAIDQVKAALKGQTVGVQSATTSAQFADQVLADVATIRRYDTQENMVLDLGTGRIDAGLADAVVLQPYLESPEGRDASPVGPMFEGGPFGEGLGIALRQGEPDLQAAMDAAIRGMKDDGTLAGLGRKWFGFDVVAE